MLTNSIDIQPPFAKKKREFIAKHKDSRPDSIYIQRRAFNNKGLLERETWTLDNSQEVIDLDQAQYVSQNRAKELQMQALEPSAVMRLAKQQDYYGDAGKLCILYQNKVFYSSIISEIVPPFKEEIEPEYDLSKDFENFRKH